MQNQMPVFLRHQDRSWPATHQEIDIGPTQVVVPPAQQGLLVLLDLRVLRVPLAYKEVQVPLALPESKALPVLPVQVPLALQVLLEQLEYKEQLVVQGHKEVQEPRAQLEQLELLGQQAVQDHKEAQVQLGQLES
jgi:hypothetical protein